MNAGDRRNLLERRLQSLREEMKALQDTLDSPSEGPFVSGNANGFSQTAADISVFRTMLESFPDPIAAFDKDTNVVFFNKRFAEDIFTISGIMIREGISLLNEYPELFESLFKQNIERVLRDEEFSIEVPFTQTDGKQSIYEISFFPIKQNGEIIGFIEHARDITRRVKAEKALELSKQQLTYFFDSGIQAYFFLDQNGKILLFNRVANQLSLLFHERNLKIHDTLEDALPADLLKDLRYAFTSAVKGKYSYFTKKITGKKQQSVWLECTLIPVHENNKEVTGVILTLFDVTQRKEAELTVEYSEERFRSIFEQSPIGIALLNGSSVILSANRAFHDFLSISQPGMTGKIFQDFLSSDENNEHSDLFSFLVQGKVSSYRIEKQFIIKGSEFVWGRITMTQVVMQKSGQSDIFLAMVEDITERRQKEEEIAGHITKLETQKKQIEEDALKLNELNSALEHSQKELIELNASKDRFFSIVAHDLRSPFTPLLGFSEELMSDAGSLSKAEVQKISEMLHISAKGIFELLENLLEWSRLQIQSAEPIFEVFDLSEASSTILKLIQPMAQKKKIICNENIEPNLLISGNKNLYQTALRNLLSNAVKFTHPGGSVSVSAKSAAGFARISVADDGIGIPEKMIGELFRLDVKISRTGTMHEKGTGLGLILARDCVYRNKGELSLQSTEGAGTVFTFTIPLAE